MAGKTTFCRAAGMVVLNSGLKAALGAALIVLAGCSSQEETSLSALHYFNKGNAAFMAEDFARAIRHYRLALEMDGETADIHFNLGLAYYRAESYENAARAYQQALRLDPNFAQAHLNLALAFDKLYNLEAANFHYNTYRSLMAPPEDEESRDNPAVEKRRGRVGATNASVRAGGAQPSAKPNSNPFKGSRKWWIQDPAKASR